MATKIIVLLCVFVMHIVHGGVINRDGYKCVITSFEKHLFDKALVLDNRLMCEDDVDDKLRVGGYCIHTYKCPLDVLNTSRFNTVICRSDGTWDYEFANCSDLLPVVVSLLQKYNDKYPETNTGIAKKNYPIIKLKSASRLIRPPMPGSIIATSTKAPTASRSTTPTNKLQAISHALLKQDWDFVNRSCHYTKMCDKLSFYPQKCQFIIQAGYPVFFFRLCNLCSRFVCDRSIKVNIG